MIKLYWFEFTRKIAVSIAWRRRQMFLPWDKVVVWENEKLYMLRHWAKLVWEEVVMFNDVFGKPNKKVVKKKAPAKKPTKKTTPTKKTS